MPTIPEVSTAVTNMLLTTYGNTIDWPTASAALNLSAFDIKIASQAGLANATPPGGPAGALVKNGDSVVVQDAAGAAVAGSPGAAEVAGTTLSAVKLTV